MGIQFEQEIQLNFVCNSPYCGKVFDYHAALLRLGGTGWPADHSSSLSNHWVGQPTGRDGTNGDLRWAWAEQFVAGVGGR